MGYLLMLLNNVIGGFSTILSKSYVNGTKSIKNSKAIYILLAHPIAAIYFLVLSGGHLPLNITTFAFSIAYAATCFMSVMIQLTAYEKTDLIYMSVFSGAGAIVIPFVIELFLKMDFSATKYISVLFRIIAVLIPLMFCNANDKKGISVCLLLFLIAGASAMVPKFYADCSASTTNESFCFWTNIIITPLALLFILKNNDKKSIWTDMKSIKPVLYILIILCTALSNTSSIIMLHVYSLVSATTRAVFSSSVGMIITTAISVFVFKEKFRIQQAICIVFSIASIVLNVL